MMRFRSSSNGPLGRFLRLHFLRLLPSLLLLGGVVEARQTVDLSGRWQYAKVAELVYPPAVTWLTTDVPGTLQGYDYERAWFRQRFNVPALAPGERVKLHFGGVKFASRVWVNGTEVGGCVNGYNPFELDVTAAVLPGQLNEVHVGLTDWTGLFAETVDLSNLQPGEQPRDRPKNAILAPIGGRYDLYGIWQPVTLHIVPEVSVADVFVQPSVRNQQLGVRVRVRNDGPTARTVTVRAVVDDAEAPPTLPASTVTVAAGTEQDVDLEASWSGPELWSPENPRLYHAAATLEVGGQATDDLRVRFGFRELWREGDRLVLNGVPIHLLAASSWPPSQPMGSDEIRKVLLDLKAGNNKAYRLHTQPWDSLWYELADEVGMLLVEEAAVWCDPGAYRLADPVFWQNYADHLRGAVRRDRNHPSIILWSLENEILHCGGARYSLATETELAQLAGVVRAEDPTRMLTYEADLDPRGQADVVGLHYPHEFPDYQDWPNTADWMDAPIPLAHAPGGQWQWDREKPLYIGEFLWVPGISAEPFSILFGDRAYEDPSHYRNLSKGLTWRMQIEAYRRYGVSALCPWTEFEDPAASGGVIDLNPAQNHLYQVQKAAYAPQAAFVREYDTRAFTGATLVRTVDIYNDTPRAADYRLRWWVGSGAVEERSFNLGPAGHRVEQLSLEVPATPGAFAFHLELRDGDAVVYEQTLDYRAEVRQGLETPPKARIAVYDPTGDLAAFLAAQGLQFMTLAGLDELEGSGADVLVVGDDALVAGTVPVVGPHSPGEAWEAFMRGGGWIVVLEPVNYPGWIPGGLKLETKPATVAFPLGAHPLTSGLAEEDFRWWAGGHRVADRVFRLPPGGYAAVPVRIGSDQGLEYGGVVEVRRGRGGLLACCLKVVTAFEQEPTARAVLRRVFDYVAASKPAQQPIALLAEADADVTQALKNAGALALNVSGQVGGGSWTSRSALLVGGGASAWGEAQGQLDALDTYVQSGGTLWLHQAPDSFLQAAAPRLFPGLTVDLNTTVPVLRGADAREGFSLRNHDLYWIDDPGNWNRAATLSTNIARRVHRKAFDLAQYETLQVETMPVKTAGGSIAGGWGLWSNGYVAQEIQVSAPGRYLFGVVARGTSALGEAPRMLLRIDGVGRDSVGVASTSWQLHALLADLTPGTHELALGFDNDAYAPPEDRNLYLDEVRWGQDPDPGSLRFLTRPGALIEVPRGQGRILLDELAWAAPGAHGTKGSRILASLLAEVGGAVSQSTAVQIEAETMTPVGVAAGATNNGIVWLYSAGRLETSVTFSDSGPYRFDFVATGTPAAGVLPQVELRLSGRRMARVDLTAGAPTRYSVMLEVPAGTYPVALVFINDLYEPPDDRNLGLDWLRIETDAAPRLLQLEPEPDEGSATLLWETTPGRTNAVEYRDKLEGVGWLSAIEMTTGGTVVQWRDTNADGSRRFYRVRQD